MKKMSIVKRILAASAVALVLSPVAMASPPTKTVNFGEEDLECRTVSFSFMGIHLWDYVSCY